MKSGESRKSLRLGSFGDKRAKKDHLEQIRVLQKAHTGASKQASEQASKQAGTKQQGDFSWEQTQHAKMGKREVRTLHGKQHQMISFVYCMCIYIYIQKQETHAGRALRKWTSQRREREKVR